ncbi:MAG: hypothetical protein ABSG25_15665 [Bryobacteraceae bacterium]
MQDEIVRLRFPELPHDCQHNGYQQREQERPLDNAELVRNDSDHGEIADEDQH